MFDPEETMTIEAAAKDRPSRSVGAHLRGLKARGFVERTASTICVQLNGLLVDFGEQPVLWSAGETSLEEHGPHSKRTYNERVPVSMQLRELCVAPEKYDVKQNGAAHALVWGCATRRVINNERLRPHLKAELVMLRLDRDRDLNNRDVIAGQCSRLKHTVLVALGDSVCSNFPELNFVHDSPPGFVAPRERSSRLQQNAGEFIKDATAILEGSFISSAAGYQPRAAGEIAHVLERALGTRGFRAFLL